jgi:hypothetical protein
MNSESRCDAKKTDRENKSVVVTQSTRRALLSVNFFCIPIPLYVGGRGSGQERTVKVVGPRKIALACPTPLYLPSSLTPL